MVKLNDGQFLYYIPSCQSVVFTHFLALLTLEIMDLLFAEQQDSPCNFPAVSYTHYSLSDVCFRTSRRCFSSQLILLFSFGLGALKLKIKFYFYLYYMIFVPSCLS